MSMYSPLVSGNRGGEVLHFVHPEHSNVVIDADTTISQLLAALQSNGCNLSAPTINLNLVREFTHHPFTLQPSFHSFIDLNFFFFSFGRD